MARRPEFYFDEKTGYYRKRVKLQSGTYKDVRAKSKEELRAKLYDLETAQRMGVILDDKTTVAQLLAQWYVNRKDGLSYSRRRDYVNAINNHICPLIGGYQLKSVKPEDCQRVMAALSGKSNSLQAKVLGVMRMGFDCAVENGLIFRSPCAKIKAGGAPTEEKVPLTPDQCAALEDATKDTRAYLFVLIGLYTGLRREEICGLRWSDLDLNATAPHLTVNNAVRFDGGKGIFPSPLKTKAAHRTIPLPSKLADALRAAKSKSNSVFVVPAKNGSNASLQTVRNLMAIIGRRTVKASAATSEKEAKKRGPQIQQTLDFKVTPHLLRHTYITRLCQSGMDIKKIQYLAGHSDIKVTLGIYSHVVGNTPGELIGAVENAFSGQTSGQTEKWQQEKVLSING